MILNYLEVKIKNLVISRNLDDQIPQISNYYKRHGYN